MIQGIDVDFCLAVIIVLLLFFKLLSFRNPFLCFYGCSDIINCKDRVWINLYVCNHYSRYPKGATGQLLVGGGLLF